MGFSLGRVIIQYLIVMTLVDQVLIVVVLRGRLGVGYLVLLWAINAAAMTVQQTIMLLLIS
jgi:hypothetical protein